MLKSPKPLQLGSKFLQDKSGSIAPIFGLLSVVLLVSAGVAVDYGRWLNARNQTQVALDSAVLAAGRTLQLNKERGYDSRIGRC